MYVHKDERERETLLLYVAYFIGLIRIPTIESSGHFPEEKPVSTVVLAKLWLRVYIILPGHYSTAVYFAFPFACLHHTEPQYILLCVCFQEHFIIPFAKLNMLLNVYDQNKRCKCPAGW